MRWVELSIQGERDEAEEMASLLGDYVQGGAVIEEWPGNGKSEQAYFVRIYLPYTRLFKEMRLQIEKALQRGFGVYPIQIKERPVNQKDWFISIRQQFNLLEVGETLLIKASWADKPVPAFRKVIELDPGYAFGTGLHPTTRLCLIHLEKKCRPGMVVLDLGTGSGILAIAAARLGASSVLALDTDSNALYAAKNNIIANSVGNIVTIKRGTLKTKTQRDLQESFDLILVNIISRVICDFAARFACVLKPGGVVIASGIDACGLDEVLIGFALADLKLEGIFPDGEWFAVIASKDKN